MRWLRYYRSLLCKTTNVCRRQLTNSLHQLPLAPCGEQSSRQLPGRIGHTTLPGCAGRWFGGWAFRTPKTCGSEMPKKTIKTCSWYHHQVVMAEGRKSTSYYPAVGNWPDNREHPEDRMVLLRPGRCPAPVCRAVRPALRVSYMPRCLAELCRRPEGARRPRADALDCNRGSAGRSDCGPDRPVPSRHTTSGRRLTQTELFTALHTERALHYSTLRYTYIRESSSLLYTALHTALHSGTHTITATVPYSTHLNVETETMPRDHCSDAAHQQSYNTNHSRRTHHTDRPAAWGEDEGRLGGHRGLDGPGGTRCHETHLGRRQLADGVIRVVILLHLGEHLCEEHVPQPGPVRLRRSRINKNQYAGTGYTGYCIGLDTGRLREGVLYRTVSDRPGHGPARRGRYGILYI